VHKFCLSHYGAGNETALVVFDPDNLKAAYVMKPNPALNPVKYTGAGDAATIPLGIEVDSKLFLVRRCCSGEGNARFYFPARKNFDLYTHIVSTFQRFEARGRGAPFNAPEIVLLAEIDIGIRASVSPIWQSGTCPGVFFFDARDPYAAPQEEIEAAPQEDMEAAPQEEKDFRYVYSVEGDCARRLDTRYYYFNNGTLRIGLDSFRTVCQLWAAFTCASVITIRGPGSMVRDFKMSLLDFAKDSAGKLEAKMIATYGTLLAIGPKHFNYAIRILETTKHNIRHFINFLRLVNFEDANVGVSELKWVKVMEEMPIAI
jgi:hypothetical protein